VLTSAKPPRISVIQLATPIHKVEPIYPPLAKQTRTSGTVELIGVLGTDGRIHELHVVSGHPLLIQAAIDAVKQWVFAPTILNGQPVEVQAPIQVNFILNR
jgi:protein TonB